MDSEKGFLEQEQDFDDDDFESEMDGLLDNIIILNDENGNEIKFEFLDLIEYEDQNYVILLPLIDDDDRDDGQVIILRVDEAGDEETEAYVSVDDADTLNAVFQIFKEKFQDEFNFAEDET